MSSPWPESMAAGSLPFRRSSRLRAIPAAIGANSTLTMDSPSAGRIWTQRYRRKLQITDISIIVTVVTFALLARLGALDFVRAPLPIDSWTVPLVVMTTWIVTLGIFHTRDSRIIGVGATEYKHVISASVVTFGLLAIAFLLLDIDAARAYFLLALPLGLTALTLARWLWRKWLLNQRRFGHYLSRAIVVGTRDDIEYVIGQMDQHSGAAYCIVGAALDTAGVGGTISAGKHKVPIVADFAQVARATIAMGIDTVIVAGHPSGGSHYVRNLGWELEGTSAELVLSSRLTDVAGPRIHFRPVEGLPLIHVEIPHFEGGKHVLKRSVDVIVSAFALLMSLPLLAVIAALIKLDTSGPVLFLQERVGRNGHTFRMLKFRSMSSDAEARLSLLRERNEGSGLLFKMRNDPRVTRVGRVIRKYSLDELPQLWNILVGDMSLVGPRPPLPDEVRGYDTHVHRRLYIKPGLTGLWQISGRSDLSWEESVRLDLYYVENWSLTGDLIILWRTFRVVVNPVGAY
jgi:exopolysaccharide biosynthesis polyprenyl glycosylphosphotransferase